MKPIELGVRYRKITALIFILLILAGVSGFLIMPRYEDPQHKVFTCRILASYPGATPEQVESLVTKPLEEKINELKDVKTIYSSSLNGISNIFVDLIDSADREKAWDDLRRKVNEAKNLFPPGVEINEINDQMIRISLMIVHLVAPPGQQATVLHEISDEWKDSLKQVPGVERVEVTGLPQEQVQVIINPGQLASRKLSWANIADTLQKRNVSIPGGILRDDQMGLLVESSGEYKTIKEIEETTIYQQPTGEGVVKIKDVASVNSGLARIESLVETNGEPSVAITIFAKEGRSVSAVESSVNKRFEELKANLPPGVKFLPVFNQANSIKIKFNELWIELCIAMLMVLLVCTMGLHWRTAVMVAFAVPISIAIGFCFLPGLGVALHQISIAALIIALGILVDDAIVVNDNIERHLALGGARYDAIVNGTKEVAIPIFTATAATIAAFVPLMLLGGNIGAFIHSLPLVVTITMITSMLVSLCLVPVLRYWTTKIDTHMRDNTSSKYQTGFLGNYLNRLSKWYELKLEHSLQWPTRTLIIAFSISIGAFALVPFLGVQFFPYAEKAEFVIDVNTPRGSSLYITASVAREVTDIVRKKEGVKDVLTYVGEQSPKFYYNEMTGDRDETLAYLVVKTNGRKIAMKLIKELRDELSNRIPGTRVTVKELEQGLPVGAPVAIRIKGDDITELREISDKVASILSHTPGAINIHDDMGPDTYTLKVNSSTELTTRWGVSEKDIASTVRIAVDGLKVGDYRQGNKIYPIVLRSSNSNGAKWTDLANQWVPSWKTGAILPLTQVASVEAGWTSGTIQRRSLQRTLTVKAYTDGTLPDEIIKTAAKEINTIPLPAGYYIEFGGENEERDNAFASLGRLAIIVVLLIYIIIAMQFYSLVKPLIIMLTVFLAVSGAVIGLFVTGTPIGFMAILGVISLSGIVVRNGIVLVDFIVHGLRQGMILYDSIIYAGKVRLRPILLTTATAVFGLMPMAITGGSLWRPLAVSIISGLIFSTLLTLIVIPNVFYLVSRRRNKFKSDLFLETGVHEKKL